MSGNNTESVFRIKGRHNDVISIEFPDEVEHLYIGRDVLCCASPALNAMLRGNMVSKEQQTRSVEIVDISLKDFEEFLLCICPGTLGSVNGKLY